MRQLTEAETDLLIFIGKEAYALLQKAYKTAKDKNIDLDALLEEARDRNKTTIDDVEV